MSCVPALPQPTTRTPQPKALSWEAWKRESWEARGWIHFFPFTPCAMLHALCPVPIPRTPHRASRTAHPAPRNPIQVSIKLIFGCIFGLQNFPFVIFRPPPNLVLYDKNLSKLSRLNESTVLIRRITCLA